MPESAIQRTAPRPALTILPSTLGREARERRWNVVPRPTSSSESTKRRSFARRLTRGTAARAPRWSACPV